MRHLPTVAVFLFFALGVFGSLPHRVVFLKAPGLFKFLFPGCGEGELIELRPNDVFLSQFIFGLALASVALCAVLVSLTVGWSVQILLRFIIVSTLLLILGTRYFWKTLLYRMGYKV